MANYPQLDDCSGVWTLKEVNDAVMGGYWRQAGSRALFAGGQTPTSSDVIDYVTIASTGDAADFGDLDTGRKYMGTSHGCNFVRAFFNGGEVANVIQYVTFVTTGNATDFGDLTETAQSTATACNSTRAIVAGGYIGTSGAGGRTEVMQYYAMSTLGNAVDFGNLTTGGVSGPGGLASPTRGIFAGGDSPTVVNVIDYVTIASTGNATDFGDLSEVKGGQVGANASSTRGVFGADRNPAISTSLDYITIASTGNGVDYGDITVARGDSASANNSKRAILGSGNDASPGFSNVIDYWDINTGGAAVDFGNLTVARRSAGGASNAHGGLNDGYQGTRT